MFTTQGLSKVTDKAVLHSEVGGGGHPMGGLSSVGHLPGIVCECLALLLLHSCEAG